MKINIKKSTIYLIICLFVVMVYSCTPDRWEENYTTPAYLNDGSLMSVLTKTPDYSEFTGLLKKTGYDSLLRRADLYTVLTPKNGAFTGIDTVGDISLLKKIIGIHILPSAIFTRNMNNTSILACSGKPVYFSVVSNGHHANGYKISETGTKVMNGLIYEIEHAIVPNPNLFEAVAGNPNFSLFNDYIASSFAVIPDPSKNKILGYDITTKPIYQEPVTTMLFSQYLTDAKINDEKTTSTVFIPTNSAVNTVLSRLLQSRANRTELIVPKLGTAHGDTTIGYYFIPKNQAYQGDSAILRDYLFKNIIVRGNKQSLATGVNTFTNIDGNQFNVSSSQVEGSAISASNGTYYTLNDVTLPDSLYRPKFMFVPSYKSNTGKYSLNPGVVFSGGTSPTPVYTTGSTSAFYPPKNYRGFATSFNFIHKGGRIDFNLPFAIQGYYIVILKNWLDDEGCIVNANCGDQLLKQNINTSTLYALSEGTVDVDLGTIHVAANGPVQLTFTCAGMSPKTVGRYLFSVDFVTLVPVSAP